jgi:hypothetical protein
MIIPCSKHEFVLNEFAISQTLIALYLQIFLLQHIDRRDSSFRRIHGISRPNPNLRVVGNVAKGILVRILLFPSRARLVARAKGQRGNANLGIVQVGGCC